MTEVNFPLAALFPLCCQGCLKRQPRVLKCGGSRGGPWGDRKRRKEKMDLRQLAEEYSESAAKLARGLEKIRRQLATARGEDALALEKREEVMRLELADLRNLSRYLREYYA